MWNLTQKHFENPTSVEEEEAGWLVYYKSRQLLQKWREDRCICCIWTFSITILAAPVHFETCFCKTLPGNKKGSGVTSKSLIQKKRIDIMRFFGTGYPKKHDAVHSNGWLLVMGLHIHILWPICVGVILNIIWSLFPLQQISLHAVHEVVKSNSKKSIPILMRQWYPLRH